jgi:hypothetical protein
MIFKRVGFLLLLSWATVSAFSFIPLIFLQDFNESTPTKLEEMGGGATICTVLGGPTACHVVLYRLPSRGAAQLRASGNPSCRCCNCWYITKCTQNTDITSKQ